MELVISCVVLFLKALFGGLVVLGALFLLAVMLFLVGFLVYIAKSAYKDMIEEDK